TVPTQRPDHMPPLAMPSTNGAPTISPVKDSSATVNTAAAPAPTGVAKQAADVGQALRGEMSSRYAANEERFLKSGEEIGRSVARSTDNNGTLQEAVTKLPITPVTNSGSSPVVASNSAPALTSSAAAPPSTGTTSFASQAPSTSGAVSEIAQGK